MDHDIRDALDAALEDLPDDSVIKPFLMNKKSGGQAYVYNGNDKVRTLAERKDEGGMEGVEIGKLRILKGFVEDGILSALEAAKRANTTVP